MSETFSHFLTEVAYVYHASLEFRFGQTCFNVLYKLNPDLATSLTGTDVDPYYDDDKVPEFLKRVRDEWAD
jgi:hypothetical protein